MKTQMKAERKAKRTVRQMLSTIIEEDEMVATRPPPSPSADIAIDVAIVIANINHVMELREFEMLEKDFQREEVIDLELREFEALERLFSCGGSQSCRVRQ